MVLRRSLMVLASSAVACTGATEGTDSAGRLPVEEPPCTEISLRRIEFDAHRVGGEPLQVAEVQISNPCGGILILDPIEVGGQAPDGVFEVALDGVGEVFGGQTRSLNISFDPPLAGEYKGRVEIATNAPDEELLVVRMEGVGLAPEIAAEPAVLDFGAVPVGCAATRTLVLRNEGDADLEIQALEAVSGQASTFTVRPDALAALPATLAPYDWTVSGPTLEVGVDFKPAGSGVETGQIAVRSDDPATGDLEIEGRGEGMAGLAASDSFIIPDNRQADIVFTVDRSSDEAYIDRLVESYPAFHGALRGLGTDFRVGVAVGDAGCPAAQPAWIRKDEVGTTARSQLEALIDRERQVIPEGSNEHRGFSLAYRALSPENTGEGGCMQGFLREDADLAIVHVSDASEQSPFTPEEAIAILGTVAPARFRLRQHAIVGPYPSGCDRAQPGAGYQQAAEATGGVFRSICEVDWTDTMAAIAERIVRRNDVLFLRERPVPWTVEVSVDGSPALTGWSYDAARNAIVFEEARIPEGKSRVDVSYTIQPECG